jgi:hypothetical protein
MEVNEEEVAHNAQYITLVRRWVTFWCIYEQHFSRSPSRLCVLPWVKLIDTFRRLVNWWLNLYTEMV